MNDRIPQTPPVIVPVPDGEKRPLWSVMIPAYNCAGYLKKTLESVLLQDPGPEKMQIEVLDDHSTDEDVRMLVAETGKGRVAYYCQPQNRGSLRNFETCLNRSRGEWIHLLHGDDLIKPGFYQEIENLFSIYPKAGAAFTSHLFVDECGKEISRQKKISDQAGIIREWLLKIAEIQCIQPPAIVVKRSVYEHLGGFFAVQFGEDWEMWVRIAAHYQMVHSPRYLASYRVHMHNITSQSFLSAQNIADISKVIDIIQGYLPEDKRAILKKKAKKYNSIYFATVSHTLYHVYQAPEAAIKQAKAAIKMSKNGITLLQILMLRIKILLGYHPKRDPIYRTLKPLFKKIIRRS